MKSTCLSLLIGCLWATTLVADETEDLLPLRMVEPIPAVTQSERDQPELLPPAQLQEQQTSLETPNARQAEFEIAPPEVMEPAVIGEDVVIDEPSRDRYEGVELPDELGLPCVTLPPPRIVLSPVRVTSPIIVQPQIVFSTGPPVLVRPAPWPPHPHLLQTVETPYGMAVIEVEPVATFVPGQPIRNRVRARRSGLFR